METDVPGIVGDVGNTEASATVWEETVVSGDKLLSPERWRVQRTAGHLPVSLLWLSTS